MADLDLKLDLEPLNRAMHMADQWSNSAPNFLAARTAQRIVSKAVKYTPFVPMGRIDTELAVTYKPGLTPTGRVSKDKKKEIPVAGMAANQTRKDMPLALLIQLARMAPGSNYNVGGRNGYKGTNSRWALPGGFQMLKGLDATARYALLDAMAVRMIKARHSSTHFLVSGWASAAKKIYNLLGFYLRGADKDASAESILESGFSDKAVAPKPNMSFVTYANGSASASVTVSNLIGMVASASGASNAANYNQALHDHGTQPLQRAIDEVAAEMTEHYWPKEQAEMAQAFNAIR